MWRMQAGEAHICSSDSKADVLAGCSDAAIQLFTQVSGRLHSAVVVEGGSCSHRIDPRKALNQMFSGIKPDATCGDVLDVPFPLMVDNKMEVLVLSQWLDTQQQVQPDVIRAGSMQMQNPIHGFLFSSKGMLEMDNIHLGDLLLDDGVKQPQIVADAIKALLVDKQPAYRDHHLMEPAILVNSFNVTSQKELEEQLETAKKQLVMRNVSLELSNNQLKEDQQRIMQEKDRLMQEQQGLQDRLQKALELHLHPKTSVDTTTVADKIIRMFDDMLRGKQIEMPDILELRNAANDVQDLRQPLNLQDQLMHRSGLSQDVGASMMELLQGDSNSSAKRWAKSTPDNRLISKLRRRRTTLEPAPGFQADDVHPARGLSSLPFGGEALAQIVDADNENEPVAVDRPLTPEVERLLQAAADTSNFNFDMYQLTEASGNQPLSTLAYFLLNTTGLVQMFNISNTKMLALIRRLEEGYPDNPYHNRTHAACVLQIMHLLVHNGLIQQGILDGITMLACYVAAALHDFEHPGVNNDFLIKTRNLLAILYNDASPNENHHVAGAYSLLMSNPGYNYAEKLTIEDKNILRASVIELVLATDMKKHFGLLSQFQTLPGLTAKSISGLPMMSGVCEKDAEDGATCSLSAQQKLLIVQVALKCADLGHLAAPHQVHKRWVNDLTEEFFQQGDQERARGMKVSPLMDRNETAGLTKSQVGFFEIVAMPLFRGYVEFVPAAQPMLDGVKANYQYWHSVHHVHN
ncbi:hypothetical protein WJX74_001716 [Apatococcus lobatus]|uniref:Phosphodiesterase n=1 Tax=Apatococcus lobatus TaxID=904363 RepID=A0AAW1QMZ5_9CHLO